MLFIFLFIQGGIFCHYMRALVLVMVGISKIYTYYMQYQTVKSRVRCDMTAK